MSEFDDKEKRDIIERFKSGTSITKLSIIYGVIEETIEDVIRQEIIRVNKEYEI